MNTAYHSAGHAGRLETFRGPNVDRSQCLQNVVLHYCACFMTTPSNHTTDTRYPVAYLADVARTSRGNPNKVLYTYNHFIIFIKNTNNVKCCM